MLNKILVFGGIALIAILVVENMVTNSPAYLFISAGSKGWLLSFVSAMIGMGIGYGLSGMFKKSSMDDDNLDF
ncbi:hypothetical protein A9Q91_05860 [Candidatus Gracilibacteria bacterium 28_42_T64]|nr:hypothetical protein A9Q91_05860 [Candidatus Gracilibacteria bacterium 28_42_T64]